MANYLKESFPVKITAKSTTAGGTILYSWTEQVVGLPDGDYTGLASARTGTNNAREKNNSDVAVPFYASLDYEGFNNGAPYYTFQGGGGAAAPPVQSISTIPSSDYTVTGTLTQVPALTLTLGQTGTYLVVAQVIGYISGTGAAGFGSYTYCNFAVTGGLGTWQLPYWMPIVHLAPGENAKRVCMTTLAMCGIVTTAPQTVYVQAAAVGAPSTNLILFGAAGNGYPGQVSSILFTTLGGGGGGSGGGGGGLVVGTTTISGGSPGAQLYDNSGVLGEIASPISGTFGG